MTTGVRQNMRRCLALAVGLVILTACSLPEPDGTEAAIIDKAEGLPQLAVGQGRAPEAVVRNGLLLSPDVRAKAAEVSASADEVRVQRAALFPSLGLSIDGGVGDAATREPGIELRGRQLILDFGQTKREVTIADLDLQTTYLEFHQSVDDAIFDVLVAYDAVLKNVRLLNVRRAQLKALSDLQALVTEQVEIGAVPSSDELEARKRTQSAEFLVLDTELSLAEARDRISELTGQSKGGQVPLIPVGSCTSPDDTDETRLARLELARAQLNLEVAENARTPGVFVEPVVRSQRGDGGVRVGVDVGVNSDLLRGGALSAAVNAARNTLNSADARVAAARRTDILVENRLRRDIAAAGAEEIILNRQVDLLEQTRSLFRSQYFDLGTRQIKDLLDNEDEYYDRQAELIELRSDLVANQLECAIREDSLRGRLGIEEVTLYDFPLSADQF